jgi:peptidyl-tRNA hydrolase
LALLGSVDIRPTEIDMERIVQYIIINREIVALGAGVVATQAAHASLAGYLLAPESEPARAWAHGTFTKIALAVEDEAALRAVAASLASAALAHRVIEESRLGGKATALGVAPLPKSAASAVLGRLPLLR